jgi:hypothetical protein
MPTSMKAWHAQKELVHVNRVTLDEGRCNDVVIHQSAGWVWESLLVRYWCTWLEIFVPGARSDSINDV